MFGFFKTAAVRKLPNILVDSYLAMSNGVFLHLNGTTNVVTRLTPVGNGANFGDLANVAVSPDGTHNYWATGGNTIKSFFYRRNGDTLTQLSAPGTSLQTWATYSPDGKMLITNAGGNIWLVDTASVNQDGLIAYSALPWNSQAGGGACAFTLDSNYVLFPSTLTPFVRTFRRDIATKTWVERASMTLPTMPVRLLFVDTYSVICFFSTTDAPSKWTFDPVANTYTSNSLTGITTRNITDVALTPDGAYLTLTHNGGADFYKKIAVGQWQLIGSVPSVTTKALSCAWTSDGKFLAVGMSSATPALRFFLRSGDVLTQVDVPSSIGGWTNSGQVSQLAFSS
jgi:hypothetical protein